MAIQKESIGRQIKRIRMGRKLDLATGFLITKKTELTTPRKKITVVGLFVSDENTFLVRPHVFEKRVAQNAKKWAEWLSRNYGKILRGEETAGILENMSVRTDKFWRLYRIIGVLPNDHTGLVRTATRKTRNKTKSKRR